MHTDLCHADPLLQQPRSLLAAQAGGPKAGGQDRVGQLVELTYGGPDGPTNALPPFLVPLGPQRAEAVVRDQTDKQLLGGDSAQVLNQSTARFIKKNQIKSCDLYGNLLPAILRVSEGRTFRCSYNITIAS